MQYSEQVNEHIQSKTTYIQRLHREADSFNRKKHIYILEIVLHEPDIELPIV